MKEVQNFIWTKCENCNLGGVSQKALNCSLLLRFLKSEGSWAMLNLGFLKHVASKDFGARRGRDSGTRKPASLLAIWEPRMTQPVPVVAAWCKGDCVACGTMHRVSGQQTWVMIAAPVWEPRGCLEPYAEHRWGISCCKPCLAAVTRAPVHRLSPIQVPEVTLTQAGMSSAWPFLCMGLVLGSAVPAHAIHVLNSSLVALCLWLKRLSDQKTKACYL